MLSEKQLKIITFLRENNQITLDEATELIGYGIYYRQKHYVGQTMSRMVKQGHIVRVKRGLFELPNMGNTIIVESDDLFANQ